MEIPVLGDQEQAVYHPLDRVLPGIQRALAGIGNVQGVTDYRGWDAVMLSAHPLLISYLDCYEQLDGFDDLLADYIAGGGRVLALHNGIITPKGSRLENVYGGNFLTHPPYCRLYFQRRPLTGANQDLQEFALEEEPYMISSCGGSREVFLTFCYEQKQYTAGFVRDYKKGKLICESMRAGINANGQWNRRFFRNC